MTAPYYDSSALVKLVLDEPDADALREYARREPPGISCALARAEVVRVVRRQGAGAISLARAALGRFELVELNDDLLDAAALLPVAVRTLDAIHLAAAIAMGDELSVVVTYDERMARAARLLGLEVVAPR